MHAADIGVLDNAIVALRNWQTQAINAGAHLDTVTFTINNQPMSAIWNTATNDWDITAGTPRPDAVISP